MGKSLKKSKARKWSMDEVRKVKGVQMRDADPWTDVISSTGSTANRDLPESGTRVVDDTTSLTLVWGGTYAALRAVQPDKGDTYVGYESMPVQMSTLSPRRGLLGQLTIVLSDKVEEDGEEAVVLKDRWEIEWQQVEKDLVQHPYIADDVDAATIIEQVEFWKNAEVKLRAKFKYLDENAAEQTLTTKALEVATKILRGHEKYAVYAPVMRWIRDYQGRPDPAACGFIESPTESIAGYVYLKTGDRLAQQGDDAWLRNEEWTGADDWDTDLYTIGAGWNTAVAP